MRLLGFILMATVGLAVAAAVAKLIVLAIVLATIIAVLTRPKETISMVVTLGVLNLFTLYPICMLMIAGVGLAHRLLADRRMRAAGQTPELENNNSS